MQRSRSQSRGRLKFEAPNIPISLDNSVPDPRQVANVFNIVAAISAANVDIIRGGRDKVNYPSYQPQKLLSDNIVTLG